MATTATSRREDLNPRLSSVSASLRHQDTKVETHASASTAAPRREGRNPRLSYNFPRFGVNHHPHNEEVNPYCGVFLGGTFTPETSINSPVAMERSIDLDQKK